MWEILSIKYFHSQLFKMQKPVYNAKRTWEKVVFDEG